MCCSLSVSRSGFYRWCKGVKSPREEANEKLLDAIRTIHEDSQAIYGSPKVSDALRAMGMVCNHKRVARLMRSHGIRSKIKRRFKVTTHSRHTRPVAPNLVRRDFSAPAPDRLWTSDITYIRTGEGWLYLAVFLDTFSRLIVGWAMGHRLNDRLVLKAFQQAWRQRRPPAGLVVHSDRGSQYCSHRFKGLLETNGYQQSMGITGNCYENAITESFFASLKSEWVYHEKYTTRAEASRSIFKYIEIFYNRQRIHAALGGVSPEQFEILQAAA